MVIAEQESTRGQHGIQQQPNLQKVLDLLVFQISNTNFSIFKEGITLFQ